MNSETGTITVEAYTVYWDANKMLWVEKSPLDLPAEGVGTTNEFGEVSP